MEKKRSVIWRPWRLNLLKYRLLEALIVFELVLSVIFLVVSYLTGNIYFKGVGIGLIIAWVTSALAYWIRSIVKP
jgi:uncharacterized membrane protein YvlD (DUF360 family)